MGVKGVEVEVGVFQQEVEERGEVGEREDVRGGGKKKWGEGGRSRTAYGWCSSCNEGPARRGCNGNY